MITTTKEDELKWDIIEGTKKDIAWLDAELEAFDKIHFHFKGKKGTVFKSFFVKNEEGLIIAGIKGWIYLNDILFIDELFIHENYRHKKLGSILLNKIEVVARELNVKTVWNYTFDFQAKDFYLLHNYEIFGVLENCPTDHKSYFLKKTL